MRNEEINILFSIQENWEEIKRQVQNDLSVSDISYSLWIDPLEVDDVRGDYVYIVFDKNDERALEYLDHRFNIAFGTVIYEKTGKALSIIFKFTRIGICKESDTLIEDEFKLNPEYTFDSFVEGKCNSISYRVSKMIAENSAILWNPYFLYGESGLGKTHLLHAIGNSILNNDSTKTVLYVTCKQYIKDFVDSIKSVNGSNAFKSKYMNADVLLIDDLEHIIDKEASLEMFTDMLDAFSEANIQVIISADRNFREFYKAPKRFMNRMAYGIITDLTTFDHETSCKIISKIAKSKGITLSEDVKEYLSKNFGNNYPELQSVMNKIEFYSIQNKRLHFEKIDEIIKYLGNQ